MSGEPFPKSKQLARGAKRYKRKVASARTWQRIIDAKIGPCRVCGAVASNGRVYGRIQFHHVVSRAQGGGDVADNIVPVCQSCHVALHHRLKSACRALCATLTDAEYAHAIQAGGEAVFERVYGIEYER